MQKQSELKNDNEGNARVTLLERLFSRESRYLPLILKLQLAFLFVLVVMAFFLPTSGSERGIVVVAAGVLAGLNWAILDHVRQR
ncbi:MAG TPA: hypothetical protein VHM69_14950 [Rubrobacter sp.]|nr:hypothetical protein [Rubrobacter sp.]